jgi:PPOX class probable F420-dependent enzyme
MAPMPNDQLDARELAFLVAARRAILATIDPDGRPRPISICFVVDAADPAHIRVLTPLDDKPKAVEDKRDLARVRDIRARPEVSLLIERWDEDWSKLGWLRLNGRATLVEPTAVPLDTIGRLRDKYPQYATHALESSPMIAIDIDRATSWGALDPS